MNLYKLALFVVILVSPLRAYSLGNFAGFHLSLFRFSLGLMVYGVVLRWLRSAVKLPSPYQVGVLCFTIISLLVMLLISFMSSSNIYEGDAITRFLVKFFGFLFVLFFLFAFSSRDDILLAVQAFLLSTIIPLSIGAYQLIYFLTTNEFPPLPFSSFSVITSPSATDLGVVYGQYPRLTSTFLEPNYYGMFLVIVILLNFAFINGHRRDILPKPILWVIICFSIIQLIFTLSLSACLDLIVGLLVFISLTRPKWRRNLVILLILVLIGLASNYAISTLWNMSPIQAISYRFSLRMQSAPQLWDRTPYFLGAIKAFLDSPLIGVGYSDLGGYVGGTIGSAHNAFLTILAAHGMLAFLPLITFFVYLVCKLYKKLSYFRQQRNESMAWVGMGLLSSTMGLIAANQFYDAMFSFDSSWILLAMDAAYVVLPVAGTKRGREAFDTDYMGDGFEESYLK